MRNQASRADATRVIHWRRWEGGGGLRGLRGGGGLGGGGGGLTKDRAIMKGREYT